MDESSWQEFYEMYWRAIYGYALRFGMREADAQDIVQEVFVKIFRQMPAFDYDRGKGRFLSWVKTVTRTTVLDAYRRKNARIEGKLKAIEPGPDESGLEGIADPDGHQISDPWELEWQKSLMAQGLMRVRARVSEITYSAFCLYALDGKSVKDVGEALGIAPSTVYVHSSRIMTMLKEEVSALATEA